jgi:hypothetical protein
MATKKKTKKSAPKPSAKRKPLKKSAAKKTAAPKKRLATKPVAKAKATKKTPSPKHRPVSTRGKREQSDSLDFEPKGLGARSGGQSGDLQGLSNRESANSESVDELLEEGNAFEAEAVKGVEDAPDADEGEVTTHEVPEDDVPREYDDQ